MGEGLGCLLLESDEFKQGIDDRNDDSCGDSEDGDQELGHCMEDKAEDDDVRGYCNKSQYVLNNYPITS